MKESNYFVCFIEGVFCVHKKNSSFEQYFSYEEFLSQFFSGEDPFEFVYQDKLIIIEKGNNKYLFTIENETFVSQQEFSSANELVEFAKIDNKSLKQIWNSLK